MFSAVGFLNLNFRHFVFLEPIVNWSGERTYTAVRVTHNRHRWCLVLFTENTAGNFPYLIPIPAKIWGRFI